MTTDSLEVVVLPPTPRNVMDDGDGFSPSRVTKALEIKLDWDPPSRRARAGTMVLFFPSIRIQAVGSNTWVWSSVVDKSTCVAAFTLAVEALASESLDW